MTKPVPFGRTWVLYKLDCGHEEYGTPHSHKVRCTECKALKDVVRKVENATHV